MDTSLPGNFPNPVYSDGEGLTVPAATATVVGGVKLAAHQANLSAAPTQADFNTLLANLQAAGVMAAS